MRLTPASLRPLALAALASICTQASAHEVTCYNSGALCGLWSRNFAGGRVTTDDVTRQGSVTVDLEIAPDGHVAGCTVTRPSGNPALDADTCAQLQAYAHYRPALDDAGEPTTGSDTITIDWVFRPPAQTVPEASEAQTPDEPAPKPAPLPEGLLAV